MDIIPKPVVNMNQGVYYMRMKTLPHLQFETPLWQEDFLVCGIDEVGRGCFAGPLVVGAVVLKPINHSDYSAILSLGIQDSKLLSPKKRKKIKEAAQPFILFQTVEFIPVEAINKQGLGYANKLGFQLAAKKILKMDKRVFFLTDAFKIPEIEISKQKNIIRGDSTSVSIALASILAKLERDSYMEKLSLEFPDYGFEKHKGYGTLFHRKAINTYGLSPHHRTEFCKKYPAI
ncbi:MAG: ribonuclease HII [Candidatus Levyibacteriota bacterium]